MSGIGTINPGSSVALTNVSGEIIKLLQDIQKDQIQAAATTAKASGALAAAGAKATIDAGKNQASMMYVQMGTSIASGVASGASLAGSYMATRNISTVEKANKPELDKLTTEAKTLSDEKAKLLTVDVGSKPKVETPAETAGKVKKTAEIDDKLKVNAEKRDVIHKKINEAKSLAETRAGQFRQASETFNYITKSVENGVNAGFTVEKANNDAQATIANSASQQTNAIYSELVQARSKYADEISQILSAMQQAKQAAAEIRG